MPAESNPRRCSGKRPYPNKQNQEIDSGNVIFANPTINQHCDTMISAGFQIGHGADNGGLRKVKEGSDKENPRRMTAGEGEMVNGNDGVVLIVVGVERTGSADEEFDEGDEEEVEEGAKEERREQVGAQGGGRRNGEIEGDDDGEDEAEVGQEFEKQKEGSWGDGSGESVKEVRDIGVQRDQRAEELWHFGRRGWMPHGVTTCVLNLKIADIHCPSKHKNDSTTSFMNCRVPWFFFWASQVMDYKTSRGPKMFLCCFLRF